MDGWRRATCLNLPLDSGQTLRAAAEQSSSKQEVAIQSNPPAPWQRAWCFLTPRPDQSPLISPVQSEHHSRCPSGLISPNTLTAAVTPVSSPSSSLSRLRRIWWGPSSPRTRPPSSRADRGSSTSEGRSWSPFQRNQRENVFSPFHDTQESMQGNVLLWSVRSCSDSTLSGDR